MIKRKCTSDYHDSVFAYNDVNFLMGRSFTTKIPNGPGIFCNHIWQYDEKIGDYGIGSRL